MVWINLDTYFTVQISLTTITNFVNGLIFTFFPIQKYIYIRCHENTEYVTMTLNIICYNHTSWLTSIIHLTVPNWSEIVLPFHWSLKLVHMNLNNSHHFIRCNFYINQLESNSQPRDPETDTKPPPHKIVWQTYHFWVCKFCLLCFMMEFHISSLWLLHIYIAIPAISQYICSFASCVPSNKSSHLSFLLKKSNDTLTWNSIIHHYILWYMYTSQTC